MLASKIRRGSLADKREFGQHIVTHGNDMAADLVELKDIEKLTGTSPEKALLNADWSHRMASARVGTGARRSGLAETTGSVIAMKYDILAGAQLPDQ
jgi:hypothetical protein